MKDIAGIYAPVILFLLLANAYMSYQTRQEALLMLVVLSFIAIFAATVSSSVARKLLIKNCLALNYEFRD